MTKINQMISQWPKGSIMTLVHLKNIGIDRELVKRYRKSGWIESVGRGAYKLKGDTVSWQGAVSGLRQQLNIYIGGKTALELKGFGHYLGLEVRELYLLSAFKQPLPQWFKQNSWNINVHFSSINLFEKDSTQSLTGHTYKEFSLPISIPERAILEMLYFIPSKQGFDEAMKIMESLTSLRPDIVQQLLQECRSIKVKRLFLYMAEKQNHFWFEQLNPDKINLGSGKRMIVKGGVLDKKYLITVPKEF